MKNHPPVFHNKEDQKQREIITKLRDEARQFLKENNELVEMIWKIDLQLQQPLDAPQKKRLLSEKNAITKKITQAGYEKKINALLEKIRTLEIALDGHSKVGGHSPYVL